MWVVHFKNSLIGTSKRIINNFTKESEDVKTKNHKNIEIVMVQEKLV